MKYFDAFSGYGGFSLGIQKAYGMGLESTNEESRQAESQVQFGGIGATMEVGQSVLPTNQRRERPVCIGYSEIDKYAVQIYSKHFPTHKPYGDITNINASELPDFDLFVGGFPCQAFSIAGKRGGFEDTRGTLIYDVLRIVKEKHPRLVLLENVKGLLSHDGGRTFKTIITALAELGYAVEWQVLNAKNFGVPQNRERVFIVGHLGGFGGRKVFPITRSNGENIRTSENDEHQSNRSSISSGRYLPNTQHITGREAYAIRRLTPTECERLMGLPDGWTEGVSDTQRYKLCGNGVVVNVVEEIIKRLTILSKDYERIHLQKI